MANTREIKARIQSIQDTMKITNAMYMISSVKMQKAKKSLQDTRPFFEEQQEAVAKFIGQLDNVSDSEFFGRNIPDEEKKRGYFVVTADKGLAGSYNHNVLNMADKAIADEKNYKLFVMGELGRQYFLQRGIHIDEQFRYTVDSPTLFRAREIASLLVEQYALGELDEIWIIYTSLKNAFTMDNRQVCLLPLDQEYYKEKNKELGSYANVVTFRPSVRELLDHMVPNVVTGYIYGALVESFASEQNARMMAMQNATDNAKDMLHDLGMEYNRVRQAAITGEVTEVIAGAKAQKNKK